MARFSQTIILLNATQTSASFESDPPYEFGWADNGTLAINCNNWGNTDNSLVFDVYWGSHTPGFLATNANITWKQDSTLTLTMTGAGGIAVKIAGILDIPRVKGRFMKLVCTLSGTAKTVDVIGWFYVKA